MMVLSHVLASIGAGTYTLVRLAVDDLLATPLPEGDGLVYGALLKFNITSSLQGHWSAHATTTDRVEFEQSLMQSLRELQQRHPRVFVSGYTADFYDDIAPSEMSGVTCWLMVVGDSAVANELLGGLDLRGGYHLHPEWSETDA